MAERRGWGWTLWAGLAVALVAASVGGCGKPARTGPIGDLLKSTIESPDFQISGSMTGSLEGTTSGVKLLIEMSGSMQFAHGDQASTWRQTTSGLTTTKETVSAGDWTYERKDGGPWTKSERKPSTRVFMPQDVSAFQDKGIQERDGRSLHRLQIDDPETLASFLGNSESTGAAHLDKGDLSLWVDDDGRLMAMDLTADMTVPVSGQSMVVTAAFAYEFDAWSGIEIEVPVVVAEATVEPFAAAETLHKTLGGKFSFRGSVSGTLTVGSDRRPLHGEVWLTATRNLSVEIRTAEESWQEVVVRNVRYVTRGDVTITRGSIPAAKTLAAVLAAAPTDRDAGLHTFNGTRLHRLDAPADTVDIAAALGLDLPTTGNDRSQFHLWADETGQPLGFGASIQWSRIMDGDPTPFDMQIEISFDTPPGGDIAAPKGAWKWITDLKGIGYAVPSNWARKSSRGTVMYTDGKTGALSPALVLSEGKTAEALVSAHIGDFGLVVDTIWNTTVDGQAGRSFMAHDKKNTVFAIGVIVVRGPTAYLFLFSGPTKRQVASEKLSDQIKATIQFDQ